MSRILRYYQDDSWLAVLGKYSPAVGFGWILRLFGAVYETQQLDSICFRLALSVKKSAFGVFSWTFNERRVGDENCDGCYN